MSEAGEQARYRRGEGREERKKAKRNQRAKGAAGKLERGKEWRRPVEKPLKPPFQFTNCAPDCGATSDWSDH